MPKQIDIEFCGSWGYGGPARELKTYLTNNYGEELEINCHSASGKTGTIKVSWIKNGALQTVWEKGRADTMNGHAQILALLKQHAWAWLGDDHFQMRWTSETLGSALRREMICSFIIILIKI